MIDKIKKIGTSREMSLVIVLILLCIFVQYRNNSFLTVSVLNDMFKNYAIIMILALGMMSVLLIGGIDISIGSTIALSGMITALLMRDGLIKSTLVAFVVSIIIGTTGGFIIGFIITKGKVIPIIATLGFMNVYRGATYLAANNQWVAAYQIPESFKGFSQGNYLSFGLINNMITVMFICYKE